ncbi:YtkA-like protein [Thermoflavifilum aggregans]|uniref:YtkA-like protein n=1 Tax=Thermoflavifilum aggregans TaxID=454188 RepID=A0A2M9CRF8_9BACT|nr:FixH family protein [Thermoflavifilum aggregans]PJJ74494.1 YtkA-like protein [Thermoflavifilum aggregans]
MRTHSISLAVSIFLLMVVSYTSCKKDNNTSPAQPAGILATTMSDTKYQVKLYTSDGRLYTGYNQIELQILDATGNVVRPDQVAWKPVMHMMNMMHSCPASELSAASNYYQGYLIFQMPSDSLEYWELSVIISQGAVQDTLTGRLQVQPSSLTRVVTFQGADQKKYVLALVAPSKPKIGMNEMIAALYTMVSMYDFEPVDSDTIRIDPRMPDMGNHSSPNNTPLTEGTDGLYHGQLNLTMTGYWKINLQLVNSAGNVLKGEPVTDQNPASSIYFEIQF